MNRNSQFKFLVYVLIWTSAFSIRNVGENMSMEEKVQSEQAYDAEQIQILEGLEAVRKRPSM